MNDKNTKKLFSKFKTLMKKKELKSGFECGDGWFGILCDLFEKINTLPPPSGFKITKVFDRFGELKVHTQSGNNSTRFLIEEAAEVSALVCDACGNPREAQQCEKCKEKDDGSSTYVPDLKEALAPVAMPDQPAVSSATFVLPSNPSDYYFKMDNDPNYVPPDFFLITPKAYWDANKHLYDQHMPVINTILNNNQFYETEESIYEYQGLASAGRSLLLSLGFVENLNM